MHRMDWFQLNTWYMICKVNMSAQSKLAMESLYLRRLLPMSRNRAFICWRMERRCKRLWFSNISPIKHWHPSSLGWVFFYALLFVSYFHKREKGYIRPIPGAHPLGKTLDVLCKTLIPGVLSNPPRGLHSLRSFESLFRANKKAPSSDEAFSWKREKGFEPSTISLGS